MDPVTHSLTGYVISNVLYKKRNNEMSANFRAFSVSTVLGAVSPDIDFVARYIGGDTFYFINHRTITHTPFGVLALSFLCALIVKFFKRDAKFTALFLGALAGGISHVLLDVTNVYSTLALWPFTDKMYSLGLMSIIDLFILSLYIISLLLSRIRVISAHKRKLFSVVLIVIIGYIGTKSYIQGNLQAYLLDEYKKGSFITGTGSPPKVERVYVMADIISYDRWNFIIENSEEFIKGSVSFREFKYNNISCVTKKKMDTAAQRAVETPLGKFVLKFSPFIDYTTERYDGGYIVRLVDLRSTFSLDLGNGPNSKYSHYFGGYIMLDTQYNPTYWSVRNPVKTASD